VAGAAALLKGYRPEVTGEDIEQLLKITAKNRWVAPGEVYSPEHGYGYIRVGPSTDLITPPNGMVHSFVDGAVVCPEESLDCSGLWLHRSDSTQVTVHFFAMPGLPKDTTIQCTRYRMRGRVLFPVPFAQSPRAWVRVVGTEGWRDSSTLDHYYEVSFARILSISSGDALVETFVYWVPGYGWFPVEPSRARVAVTAVGPLRVTAVDKPGPSATLEVRVAPNPVRRSATIHLRMPVAGKVNAGIFDLSGRRVATVADARFVAGEDDLGWDGTTSRGARSPAGVYFLRVEVEQQRLTRRFVLLGGQP
jgi:hypothetical protein